MQNINDVLFQKIGNISDEIYFIFDTARNSFQYISHAFEIVWACPIDEVLHNPALIFNTIHPDDKDYIKDFYLNARNSSVTNKAEFKIICHDQSEKFILLKVYPILENGEVTLIAGTAEDISVLKRNIIYAEKINARKNSTLEIMAHDLKGPIAMVNLMASSMQKDLQVTGNENLLKPVQIIQDLCKRNIAIIRNLVNKEFLESKEVDLHKERADLVLNIHDIIETYKSSADVIAKKIILTSSDEVLYVEMDNLKMMQVFNNLISNAIKFTPDNGVIEVNIKDKHPLVQITVHDNGIGIPKSLQPYLFDRFTRARRTGLRGEEPVGLGMSIIKAIVELHGGRIWFDSQENEGTTFYIELPKA